MDVGGALAWLLLVLFVGVGSWYACLGIEAELKYCAITTVTSLSKNGTILVV